LQHGHPGAAVCVSLEGLCHHAPSGKAALERGGGSPAERLRARNARYDYQYSPAELEERARGQLLMLQKAGKVAAVFKNHVGAKAAINAVQAAYLFKRVLPSGS
jgi:hypothetical protein